MFRGLALAHDVAPFVVFDDKDAEAARAFGLSRTVPIAFAGNRG